MDELKSSIVSETVEKIRLRTRIRCFAWAPSLPGPESHAVLGTQTIWGQPIVAVANEDNHVAFVAVDSPTTTLEAQDVWSGEVLGHFSIIPDSENVFAEPVTFDEIMQQQQYVSQMAWSPWVAQGESQRSVLVYATNEDVRARVITYSEETIGIGNEEIIYPDIQMRNAGPMKWSSKVEDGDKLTLALFTLTNVTVLKLSASHGTIITRTSHDLSGRWDELSGAVWDYTSPNPSLHFSSLQETLKYHTTLTLSDNSLTAVPKPHWREQLWDAQALFSAQHELKGAVKTKVWGLSTSPLGDFIATCSTLHPTSMIEYGPPNERRTSIAITALCPSSPPSPPSFPAQSSSAEGIIFTLRKWLDLTGPMPPSPTVISQLATQLAAVQWTPDPPAAPPSFTTPTTPSAYRHLVSQVKHLLLFSQPTILDRSTILTTLTCSPTSPLDIPKTLIAYRLASSFLSLPPTLLTATPLSREIATHHARVVSLINALIDPSASHETRNSAAPCDVCDFCAAPIELAELGSATCGNGHVFPRCGVSFLAIQRPGVSVRCGVCGGRRLRDGWIGLQEGGDEEGGGEGGVVGTVSGARVLFAAVDVCAYCGGKYTG